MESTFLTLWLSGLVLCLIQCVIALPWIWAIDPLAFRQYLKEPKSWAPGAIGGLLVAGFMLGQFISYKADAAVLQFYGRCYGAVLHLQLIVDAMILLPLLLLRLWPKGGAVALAAYREAWRQPMFWLLTGVSMLLLFVSMVVPYFTFGDDYKMMKQIGFDLTMLAPALFGVLAASISINEEIEGRTAITVMSKPITRRQFLLGKTLGILLSAGAMTLLLGWTLNWALYIKPYFDKLEEPNDTMALQATAELEPTFQRLALEPLSEELTKGAAAWGGELLAQHIGLLLGFGQVMVMVSLAAAFATRLPFVVNLVVCLVIFFLGHLSPQIVEETRRATQMGDSSPLQLVGFLAQMFNVVLPALEFFNNGPAIIRDNPLDLWDFARYVLTVTGYAVMYTIIAALIGLILFEDRDLA